MLAVIFLVSLIAAYWMNGIIEGGGVKGLAGGAFAGAQRLSDTAYEANLVSRIPHSCLIGVPPF